MLPAVACARSKSTNMSCIGEGGVAHREIRIPQYRGGGNGRRTACGPCGKRGHCRCPVPSPRTPQPREVRVNPCLPRSTRPPPQAPRWRPAAARRTGGASLQGGRGQGGAGTSQTPAAAAAATSAATGIANSMAPAAATCACLPAHPTPHCPVPCPHPRLLPAGLRPGAGRAARRNPQTSTGTPSRLGGDRAEIDGGMEGETEGKAQRGRMNSWQQGQRWRCGSRPQGPGGMPRPPARTCEHDGPA